MPANLKIFLFFILSTNITLAQIIPSFQGVYDKKSSSTSTSNYALDFDGTSDYIILDGSFLSYPWTAQKYGIKEKSVKAINISYGRVVIVIIGP